MDKLVLEVPHSVKMQLQRIAIARMTSVSTIVREILANHLNKS